MMELIRDKVQINDRRNPTPLRQVRTLSDAFRRGSDAIRQSDAERIPARYRCRVDEAIHALGHASVCHHNIGLKVPRSSREGPRK